MLTREIMGVFALGVLWLNSGLVLAVALRQLGQLLRLRRAFAEALGRGELRRGVVRDAPDGVLGRRRIHQTGRALTTDGPDRVLFTDGAQSFDVHGGTVQSDGEDIEVAEAPDGSAEVWLDRARTEEALACGSLADFEEAHAAGSRYKGFAREASLEVRVGDPVWVHGRQGGDGVFEPWEDRPLLVSMVDPIAWASGAIRRVVSFVILAALGLVLVTGIALWPPHFGLISTIGGALCLAYFLAIQPLGVALRDAIRTPARRLEGALWRRPAGDAQPARS